MEKAEKKQRTGINSPNWKGGISSTKEYHNEHSRKWRKNHPEKLRMAVSKWQKENPEKVNAKTKRWRLRNPEKVKLIRKRWRINNVEKVRMDNRNRRAVRENAEGFFTKEEWHHKKSEFHYCCAICGVSEEELLNTIGRGLTVDHIIPLNKDGTNWIDNIQPLCRSCNSGKRDRILWKQPNNS